MNHIKTTLGPGLYFVGVPIGTARDITLRALDILASADVLVAEDTRSLRHLMDIHAIPLAGRKIVTLHDHSKSRVVEGLIAEIAAGKSVAYSSEAGMPLIADPGYELSRAVSAAGLSVTCAPGPSALLTALVLAGLPTDRFHFAGFLPNASTARKRALETLRDVQATLVFYESPKRLASMLKDNSLALGPDRQAAVCRELTKKFEEVRRGTLEDLAGYYAEHAVKGEIVVVVDRGGSEIVNETDLKDDLIQALSTHSMRDAVDLVAKTHQLPRRQVYKLALSISKED